MIKLETQGAKPEDNSLDKKDMRRAIDVIV